MKVTMGQCELEVGGKYLSVELRDSSAVLGDAAELRRRMEEDGYLFLRGFHNRAKVEATRSAMLARLGTMGKLDPHFPVDAGVAGEGGKDVLFGKLNYRKDLPELIEVVEAPEVMKFFDHYLGGPALTLDYKWPRAVAPGKGTGAHYDIVYMGRGTRNLYTMWTPLGDVPMEMGTLCVCAGSHRFEPLLQTYGRMDVSKDRVKGSGWFSENPIEIVERFGGRWATTDFQAGDTIIFGMFTLHMSTLNQTGRYRTSCDTRYQLRSEPVDERFMGSDPVPPSFDGVEREVTMEQLRDRWML